MYVNANNGEWGFSSLLWKCRKEVIEMFWFFIIVV